MSDLKKDLQDVPELVQHELLTIVKNENEKELFRQCAKQTSKDEIVKRIVCYCDSLNGSDLRGILMRKLSRRLMYDIHVSFISNLLFIRS